MGALLPEVDAAWQSGNAKVAYSFIVDQCCSRACFIFDIYPLKRWSCSPLTPPPLVHKPYHCLQQVIKFSWKRLYPFSVSAAFCSNFFCDIF